MSLSTDIAQLASDAAIVHSWVQGGPTTTVAMGAGQVRSPAKLIADQDAAINQAAIGVLAQSVAQVSIATAQATAAALSQSQAGTARDQAVAAWSASTAPSEFIASINKSFFSSAGIVAAIIYDTRRDTDGGAWRKRCTATSWYTEPTFGVYRGECASEAACRAIAGAATNDYYHNTTDGKFYSLNAVAGQTEVFRGNRRHFPEVVAITAEATRIIIWDLTDSTVPMWMVFVSVGNFSYVPNMWVAPAISGIDCADGNLIIGSSNGCTIVNFIADGALLCTLTGWASTIGGGLLSLGKPIASRNDNNNRYRPVTAPGTGSLPSGQVNAVAIKSLPGAPIDNATGLPIATIAVATAAGVVRINSTGMAINSASSVSFRSVRIDLDYIHAVGNTNHYWRFPHSGILAEPEILEGAGNVPSFWPSWSTDSALITAASKRVRALSSGIAVFRDNFADSTKTLVANVTNAYNSGWMAGDIRGAWLADILAAPVSGNNLITGDSAGFAGGTAGAWAAASGASLSVIPGALTVTASAAGYGQAILNLAGLVIGQAYVLKINVASASAYSVYALVFGIASNAIGAAGSIVTQFVATSANQVIGVQTSGVAGATLTISGASLVACDADRSTKINPLTVYGSLAKTAVSTGAQLVAYSGFSAVNYLEQPYNANLDFGTGDFAYSMWCTWGTLNTVRALFTRGSTGLAGDIVLLLDNANRLRVDIFNATPVQTTIATSTATFTDGAFHLLCLRRSGTLISILVDGVTVASGTSALSVSNPSAKLRVGEGNTGTGSAPFTGSIALFRASATAPTDDQIAYICDTERHLFEPGAQCCIAGSSSSVTAMGYDEATDLLDVGTSWGRSTFKGLIRTDSEATTNGALVALAAYDGARLTAGATGSKVYIPAKYLRDELQRYAEQKATFGQELVDNDFDALAAQTAFVLPMGVRPKFVYAAGALQREGAGKQYTSSFDGFRWTVNFTTAPGAGVYISILAMRAQS